METTTWSARIVCCDEVEHETCGHESPENALMHLVAESMEKFLENGASADAEFFEVARSVMQQIESSDQDRFTEQGGGMGSDVWTMEVFHT